MIKMFKFNIRIDRTKLPSSHWDNLLVKPSIHSTSSSSMWCINLLWKGFREEHWEKVRTGRNDPVKLWKDFFLYTDLFSSQEGGCYRKMGKILNNARFTFYSIVNCVQTVHSKLYSVKEMKCKKILVSYRKKDHLLKKMESFMHDTVN